MLSINNVAMQYGGKLLYYNVNLNLIEKKRYCLVGANGCGKTTFFKIIAGSEQPTDGEANIPKNARFSILEQNQFLYENERNIDIVMQGKMELWQALNNKEALLQKENFNTEDSYKLAELEEIIMLHDGYIAENKASELLAGLGVKEQYHYLPMSALSGGYKLRVLLAKTLYINPDIMLLDEPTNHLDIVTISWLEDYLIKNYKGVLVVISHDRSFLNTIATHVLDIDYGEIREYTGNYEKFLELKTEFNEHKLLELKNSEKKIAHLRSFVERFGAKASKAKQAQSREKMIQKIELPDIAKSSRVSPNFNFVKNTNPGKIILDVQNINKAYGEKQVLKNINFRILRGEKVLFIGPNGIGKSTLLKIITANLTSDSGSFEWGAATKLAYFAQDHHESLNISSTVLNWLESSSSEYSNNKARTALGGMLFKKEEVEKDILNLSGGEAARLLFAAIMLKDSNILILDEPTNHLDLEAIEALVEALAKYEGTILMVSHDRFFSAKLANRVIALTEKGIIDYKGTYEEYLDYYKADYLSSSWLKNYAK